MIPLNAIPWRLVGLFATVLAFLGLGTFAGCEHRNAKEARAERNATAGELVEAVTANTSQTETIDTLRRALGEWRSLGTTPDEALIAVESMRQINELIVALDQRIREAKELERAKPDCAAVLSADFERACPAIARGLRDAAGSHENGPSRNSDPGRSADRPGPRR